MSNGRDKLKDFSLLKSLINSKIMKERTDRLIAQRTITDESLDNVKKPSSSLRNNRNKIFNGRKHKNVLRIPQYQCNRTQYVKRQNIEAEQETIDITISVHNQQHKERQWIIQWLCERFPKCFNNRKKVPLKIGISKDIETVSYYEHILPIDNNVLHQVIRNYVQDKWYRKAVITIKERFDLEGKRTENCTEQQIDYAKAKLTQQTIIHNHN